MAVLLNKWWLLPVLSLCLFSNRNFVPSAASGKTVSFHPVHISTVEIEHNATDKTLEITCKIYWDDFEAVLTKNNKNQKVDLGDEKKADENNKHVFNYLNNHLAILIDGKPAILNMVGFEKEDEIIFSYTMANNVSSVNKISCTNSILHDLYNDQSEIIHVIVNGKRKSTKLDYPAKQVEFVF